jgi:four helix bundle protein
LQRLRWLKGGSRSWFMTSAEIAFAQWEKERPAELEGDPIWSLPAYRLSRFLGLEVRADFNRIRKHSYRDADQLQRSVNSVGMNIAEGYGRLHGRERARFYEIALGSAREARDWYARFADLLPREQAIGKCKLLSRVIRILTVAIPQEREGSSEKRLKDAAKRRKTKKRDGPDRKSTDEKETQ